METEIQNQLIEAENALRSNIIGTVKLSPSSFVLSIILSFTLAYLLGRIYVRQSNTLSNHESLAKVFPLLAITTTIVIAVVKSSLALSLGLVGALSIVRFRTPVKEPEELTYIFLCIAIGLASGADQYLASVLGLVFASIGIYINNLRLKSRPSQNSLRLTVAGLKTNESFEVVEITKEYSFRIDFNNLITSEHDKENLNSITLSFQPKSFRDVDKLVNKITQSYPNASINIIDICNFN